MGVPPQEVRRLSIANFLLTYILYPLQVLTKDSVTVSVDAVVYYR